MSLTNPEEFKTRSRLCYYGSLFDSQEVNSFMKFLWLQQLTDGLQPDEFKFTSNSNTLLIFKNSFPIGNLETLRGYVMME